ncbi:MAG: bifunctional proline dehydrogenase/L-glutamate gamma-semialdehyde dehydrogenase [Paludibacteraceae bacterium]
MKKIQISEVVDWAGNFLTMAENEITPEELKEQKKYAILVQKPNDKILLSKLLDESSQIRDNKKLAERMKILLDRYGVPEFFSSSDQALLKLFTTIGYRLDALSVPIFKKRLRSDTSKVIINEQEKYLKAHLGERRSQHIGQNVNLLGEVVLGDNEAQKRYEHYLGALEDPKINYISVKLSGIYAQINPLNYEENKKELCKLMGNIYQHAMDHPFIDNQDSSSYKFVNLDMEEYKDIDLTMDVFISTLSEPRFKKLRAGIVIQAYLPDATRLQDELLNFAKKREKEGGASLKMRLVKGANLQMETIVSSIRGWENPVYGSKVEVDANYLNILDKALLPENAKVVSVGIASHNFFTIGYAYLLAKKNNVEQYITFEMLEGMANHLPRVMRRLEKQIILYTPVVKDEYFLNAVSYLVRRMDENTGKDNFLTYSFNLKEGSKEWNFLKKQFEEAMEIKDKISAQSKRTQNRLEKSKPHTDFSVFKNEPDTDFDLKPNKKWANEIRNQWMKSTKDEPYHIPVQVGDKAEKGEKTIRYFDHNQSEPVCVCEVSQSSKQQVDKIISIAESDPSKWRQTTLEERTKILNRVANNLANNRGNLIGCMAAITGKTFIEGDIEVSEAIDFCRYYPYSMQVFERLENVSYTPKGIILVIPPWNFPTAIPVGGVASALAGGNTVILKPATVAFPIAWEFVQSFWDAGVPKDALQVVCTATREALTALTTHKAVKHIILTGGTDTAFRILETNPNTPLTAETGGKNVMIITASSDRDQAIMSAVKSAFGNAGQKCSACSLLMVEKGVYDDPAFREKLRDAVLSVRTGSAWEGGNIVGPMVTNNNDKMLFAIDNLEQGESWLVKPEFIDKEKYILKPSVKWGVTPGSYTFNTELFGPVLGVVCINSLKHGIELVNSGKYGLTSGLNSLDESERDLWKNSIEAGNLYINRGITGAIVQRQPFGGMKQSAFGGGIKAGGTNYVACFVNFVEKKAVGQKKMQPDEKIKRMLTEPELKRYLQAIESYRKNWENEFSIEHHTQELIGEKNIFRYRPLKSMVFRVFPNDNLTDVLLVITAAAVSKTKLTLSIGGNDKKMEMIKILPEKAFLLVTESDDEFVKGMNRFERIRVCGENIPDSLYLEAAKTGKYIASTPPLAEGRVELLHYVKEQSISYEYHRYGSFSEEDAR